MGEAVELCSIFEWRIPEQYNSNMIFYASLLIFAVGGKEELIDLRWPIKIGNNSIIGKIRITKSDGMGENILTRSNISYILPLFSLEPFPQDGLNHISIAVVEHFL